MLRDDLKLTDLEWDILVHRLVLPDCLAEALGRDEHKVAAVCEALTIMGLHAAMNYDRQLTEEVLIDCVEGSTYYGSAIGVESDSKLWAIGRAGDRLADKIADALGMGEDRLIFPHY